MTSGEACPPYDDAPVPETNQTATGSSARHPAARSREKKPHRVLLLAQLDAAAERLGLDACVAVADARVEAAAGTEFGLRHRAKVALDVAAERLGREACGEVCRQVQTQVAAHRFEAHARIFRR